MTSGGVVTKIRCTGSGVLTTSVISVSESSSGAQSDAEEDGGVGRLDIVTSLRISSSKRF